VKSVSSLIAVVLSFTGASAADLMLSADGLGQLTFGTPADQVQRILHYDPPYSLSASDSCTQFTTPQFEPAGLTFMVEGKKLVRIDIDFNNGKVEATARTDTGIGLGSAEADVLKAYPAAAIKRNPDDPSWHTLIVETPDHSRGIIFETNGKTVKSIRAGVRDMISSLEG
jgi:hypothetical protein